MLGCSCFLRSSTVFYPSYLSYSIITKKKKIQAKFSTQEINKLCEPHLLDIHQPSVIAEIGEHWWPNRGELAEMPPKDPVIYRLYEGVLVYGHAIKVGTALLLLLLYTSVIAPILSYMYIMHLFYTFIFANADTDIGTLVGGYPREIRRRHHVYDRLQG